jgi:hypothetical protein
MGGMPELLAIIPFYEETQKLEKCLYSLRCSSTAVEPFIVDNNVQNVGFTKACNLGPRESLRRGHAYALLLNQDCYVDRLTTFQLPRIETP